MHDDLNGFRELVELRSVEETNRYLELGWRLVQAYVVNSPNTAKEERNEQPRYVLGWKPGLPNIIDVDTPDGTEMKFEYPKAPHPEALVGGGF